MAEYHEDGLVCDVTVVEDTSDNECYRYRLRVNRVLRPSALVISPKVGEEFSVDKVKRGACSGMWHLFGYDRAAAEHQRVAG